MAPVWSSAQGSPAIPRCPSRRPATAPGLKTVYAKKYLVATANPFASAAGCAVLKKGGTAADAAVAVQAVLGLTVPEATGLGGGGFILYYDAAAKSVQAYDGRETAPATATENYLRYIDDVSNQTAPLPNARASGRSIGTMGIPRMIERVQKEHGKLAWKDLFGDAINLANNGFKISGRLAAAISSNAASLRRDAEATGLFLQCRRQPQAVGHGADQPCVCEDPDTDGRERRGCIAHGPDRAGHRQQDRHYGSGQRRQRDHARQDDDG
jgi:gamma-glutamyltranspeptidase/glutathione hydrolase